MKSIMCFHCKQKGHKMLDNVGKFNCPVLIQETHSLHQQRLQKSVPQTPPSMYVPPNMYVPNMYAPPSMYAPNMCPPGMYPTAFSTPSLYPTMPTSYVPTSYAPTSYAPTSYVPVPTSLYPPIPANQAQQNTLHRFRCCELCLHGVTHTRTNVIPSEMIGQHSCYCCMCVRIYIDQLQCLAFLQISPKKSVQKQKKKTSTLVPKLETIIEVVEPPYLSARI